MTGHLIEALHLARDHWGALTLASLTHATLALVATGLALIWTHQLLGNTLLLAAGLLGAGLFAVPGWWWGVPALILLALLSATEVTTALAHGRSAKGGAS